jgi:hypothetical protein
VDGRNLHCPLPSTNKLNQTEPAKFSNLLFCAFFKDSLFLSILPTHCAYNKKILPKTTAKNEELTNSLPGKNDDNDKISLNSYYIHIRYACSLMQMLPYH